MARLICNECENVVMFAGNVKNGNICPKCGSGNTGKAALIKFTGTKYCGTDAGLRKWNENVRIDRATCVPASSSRLMMGRDGWRELSRLEALGLR